MKKKKKKNDLGIIIGIFIGIFIAILTIIFFVFIPSYYNEPHFKIYKEELIVSEEIYDYCLEYCKENPNFIGCINFPCSNLIGKVEIDLNWKEVCLEMVEGKCFSPKYDGIEWFDENCECIEGECDIHFKHKRFKVEELRKFAGFTYDGFIWFTKDESENEVAFFCPKEENCLELKCDCKEYKCGEYNVKNWNQIK